MSTGRTNKPLFEVLSQHPPRSPYSSGGSPDTTPPERPDPRSTTNTGTESKPKPSLEPKPLRSASRPTEEIESANPETRSSEISGTARPVVTIPLSTVYSAIALGGILILIAWIGGHKMGEAGAYSEINSQTDIPSILSEPIAQPITQGNGSFQLPDQQPTSLNNSIAGANPDNPSAGLNSEPITPPTAAPSGSGTILSAAGLLEIDPRESGLNYLVLGTFTREMTQEAIDFLGANGVAAIGIPQPNGQYRLISAELGIQGSQWTAMANQRSEHQRSVARIGTRWVRDQQGGSDFTQTQWTKYQP